MRFPLATVHLRRAQVVLILAVLIPTLLMAAVGIVLAVFSDDVPSLASSVLILTFCTTGVTGYILGSIFVGKGASLARIQNDFLGSVSHELNTPLTSMHLLLESLRPGRLDEHDTKQVISLLDQETKRLQALVGRLLELSRLELGAHMFARQPVDVAEVVRDAIAAFEVSTTSAPTPVAVSVEPGLTVVGDRATLVSALVNLLTNAWKYTDDDKRIELTARTEGRWILLAVTDNGIGMSPAEQRLAFTRFSRAKPAIDRRTPGVGLGLAFVRAIMRGHRGKVTIHSAQGKGTTFTLKLKRRRKAKPARATSAAASTPVGAGAR
jgi:two-component system, OmpR family, phosphate regulon sensor histidine kinase PhoR